MGNRIFVAVVVLLWGATMSWLMMARILPPFFQGEPPAQGTLSRDKPVCWQIEYDGRPVGYAVTQAAAGALGTTEIHSRVLIEEIELREMAPQWMNSLVRSVGEIRLDTRTKLVLDSLGQLNAFETRVRLNDLPTIVRMKGRVNGSQLQLRIQSGDINHEASYPVPGTTLLGSELIPEPKLLQVYVGRKWQQEVFSLFRPPNSSMELIQAEVVEESSIMHRGALQLARKIEYRTLSGAGVSANDTLRAVLWVAEDGTVLRHDMYLMNARLRFERCREPEMLALAEELLDLDRVATLATPNRESND